MYRTTAQKNVGWKALVATKGNRKRKGIIIAIAWFSQWSGNGLVSYYLNKVFNTIGITDTDIQLLITGILAIWNLCWAVFASFQVDRWGRRFLFLTSAAGMTLFFTLQTICSAQYALHGSQSAAHAVIAFIFLFYAFYECVLVSSVCCLVGWGLTDCVCAALRSRRSSCRTRSRSCRTRSARRASTSSTLSSPSRSSSTST